MCFLTIIFVKAPPSTLYFFTIPPTTFNGADDCKCPFKGLSYMKWIMTLRRIFNEFSSLT